jgi:hypothetical protein
MKYDKVSFKNLNLTKKCAINLQTAIEIVWTLHKDIVILNSILWIFKFIMENANWDFTDITYMTVWL